MTACEVWPGVWVGDLTAAHFWPGPKLAVRDQAADYLFKAMADHQLHFVYGRATKNLLEEGAFWLDLYAPGGNTGAVEEARRVPVLVHCSGGLHRSAVIVVYWLVSRKKCATIEEAYAHVRKYRPEIEPRPEWITGKGKWVE